MKIKTSKGHEYEAAYLGGPTQLGDLVMLQYADGRRLPEIAAENQSYASARRRARHSFDESGDGKKRRP